MFDCQVYLSLIYELSVLSIKTKIYKLFNLNFNIGIIWKLTLALF